MKKSTLIGLLAVITASLAAFSSCKKDKQETSITSAATTVEELVVTDLHHSDCLNSGVKSRDTIGGNLTIERVGNNLYFEWPQCQADCGLDSFAIRSNMVGDTLEIDVRSYGQGSNCVCEYNVDATINNVPDGRYLVKVYYGIMVGGRNIRGELFYSKWVNL